METAVRTAATFKSSRFNSTEQRPSFVKPDCFGDDLGQWLTERLRAAGHDTGDAPAAEGLGWCVKFSVAGTKYRALVGHVPDKVWSVVVENDKGFFGSMFG